MSNVHKKLKASSIAPLPSPPWTELPAEITVDILQRLGTIQIVESAQRVCCTWWKACHDPAMWHVVDLKYDPDSNRMPRVLEKICWIGVDRSQGQLFKISIANFGTKDLLNYVAEISSQLRYLQLVKCFGNLAGGFVVGAKNFPLLEELHIHVTFITKEDIESVGRYCPLLKSFILNVCGCDKLGFSPSQDDDQALAIGRSMPELRHLALLANTFTNVGLQAILDGCPHLELLDLRRCNIDLEGDLGRRCRQQIVDLKQPHASTHDYEFDSEVCQYWFSDDDLPSGFSYIAKIFGLNNIFGYGDYYDSGDDDDYFDIDDSANICCNEYEDESW